MVIDTRTKLQLYALGVLNLSSCTVASPTRNRCTEFVEIVSHAIQLRGGANANTSDVLEDLKLVLIGTDLRNGRSQGTHFVGHHVGSEGFRPEMRDEFNQVQHAMAGIYIGYRYGLFGQAFALIREREAQDDALYWATIPLGRSLSDDNLEGLPDRIRQAVCGNACWL